MDLIMLAAIAAFFGLAAVYIEACRRLMEKGVKE